MLFYAPSTIFIGTRQNNGSRSPFTRFIHSYDYDLLGRINQDRVTTLATGIDGAVLRLEAAYDVRGQLQKITSLDNATVDTGTIVNQVQFAYNDFGQAVDTWQSHSGAVNTVSTPKVQYGFADGSANTIRPMSVTYPNGRQIDYDYGTASGIDDSLSRVASIIDSTPNQHLADYSYLGSSSVVKQESPQASLQYTLISLTSSNDPDTGDIYTGLDRFGRIKDVRWWNTSSSTNLSRIKYGYDRASSRTWRDNITDPNSHHDWLYNYDDLHRLKDGERGTLNSTETAITNPQFAQCWTLDETGNWKNFRQDDNGDSSG